VSAGGHWAGARVHLDGLSAIRDFVRRNAAGAAATSEETADVVQAVDELVCNILEHGYDGNPGPVEVDVERADRELLIRIRDRAPDFDPASVPAPDLDLSLEKRPLGGMGIHLARTLTDGMEHRILPTGGNEIILRKRLAAGTGGVSHGHHDGSASTRGGRDRPRGRA
jgi:serine/threonine-protein kinase RsbW